MCPRPLLGLVSILVAALAAASPPAPAQRSAMAPSPVLAVVVSVDGLSWDRLVYYRPWYVAGLKRLLDESQLEEGARYRHLNTETGPGHSSLSTGAPPRVTGIVANRWFAQGTDGSIRAVNCVDQPAPDTPPGSPPMFYRVYEKDGRLYVFATAAAVEQWESSGETGRGITRLGYGPRGETVVFDSEDAIVRFNTENGRPKESFPTTRVAQGPGALRVPTLGDRLVEAKPGARVVSISAKDRSSIFMAGRSSKHTVYWYDQAGGRFVTSPFYLPPAAARAIVDGYNRDRAGSMLPSRYGTLWKALPLPEPPYVLPAPRPTPAPGLLDFQIPTNGLGFDHPLTVHPAGYSTALYYSPFVDELVGDLAVAFLENDALALGRGPAPDLFWISFSAQDTVSHSYGVESEENLDTLRRLDLQLGRVLAAIDRRFAKGSVVLALSADHGFPVIPEAEHARNPSFRGGRLLTTERAYPNFVERLNRLLAAELCLDPQNRPVYSSEGYNVAYNRPAFPFRTVDGPCGPGGALVAARDVDGALPRVIGRYYAEEVESVYLASERERWPKDDPATEFVVNDFDPARSGDAVLVPRFGVMTHWDPGRGAMHGSHYDYDTHVPLAFWGGPFRSAMLTRDSTPYDLAPTLAALLGVDLPDAIGRSRVP
jgi:predicted AlkP superfamily pyrophosphatase or phosphodiesterase